MKTLSLISLFFAAIVVTMSAFTGCGKKSSPTPTPTKDTTTTITPIQYVVSTFSGDGSKGVVNSSATSSSFFNPDGIVADAAGNLFVADFNNNVIRKITTDGTTSTFVGNGKLVTTPGTGINAGIFHPVAIAIDKQNNLYVSDLSNHILKITPSAVLTILAGSLEGKNGSDNGKGTAATFYTPDGLAVDANNNIYVADDNNNVIRKITPDGQVSTFAGSGVQGKTDGTGTAAQFMLPLSLTIDASGNLYVGEGGNNDIRKITPAGVVTTIAGNGVQVLKNGNALQASFNYPDGLAIDAMGNLYISDSNNNVIRELSSSGDVTTFAGSGALVGITNGAAATSSFDTPKGITFNSAGDMFIADFGNNVIRKISKK